VQRGCWEKRRDRRVRSSRLSPPQIDLRTVYGDGHVEYEAPHVRSKVAALRLDSLSDKCPRNVRSRSERQFLKCLPFRSDGSTRTGKKFEPLSRVSIYRGSQTSNAGKPKRLNQCSASISVCAGKNSSRRSLSVLTDFVCGSQCEAQSAAQGLATISRLSIPI
jgi:hypothetical protein